jgi:hypothetical protein
MKEAKLIAKIENMEGLVNYRVSDEAAWMSVLGGAA